MSRVSIIECPSKLVVAVRAYKVTDEDLMADPAAIRKGTSTTDLLNAITVRVEDPGPCYEVGDSGKLDWSKVLQGDRTVVLKENRISTWGEEYSERKPCQNCRQPVDLGIDLNELPNKPLPESSIPHVTQGVPLACALPTCGVRVEYRLLRGSDDRGLTQIQKQNKKRLSSSYLRFRVTNVEGVKSTEWSKWLQDLDADDAAYLRAAFDEDDCGVDTEVEFECESCAHIWVDDVRFNRDFLFPKYRRKVRKQQP